MVCDPAILPIEERATVKLPSVPVETMMGVPAREGSAPTVIETLVVNTLNPATVMVLPDTVVVEVTVTGGLGRLLRLRAPAWIV